MSGRREDVKMVQGSAPDPLLLGDKLTCVREQDTNINKQIKARDDKCAIDLFSSMSTRRVLLQCDVRSL